MLPYTLITHSALTILYDAKRKLKKDEKDVRLKRERKKEGDDGRGGERISFDRYDVDSCFYPT